MGPQLGGYNMEAACSLEFRSKLYGPQALPNCHGAQVVHCEVGTGRRAVSTSSAQLQMHAATCAKHV